VTDTDRTRFTLPLFPIEDSTMETLFGFMLTIVGFVAGFLTRSHFADIERRALLAANAVARNRMIAAEDQAETSRTIAGLYRKGQRI
jgi:hypothetical protein